MNAGSLARLLVVTLIAVAGAGVSAWLGRSDNGSDQRGEPFVPGMIGKANQLTRLRFDAGDWQAVLVRQDQGFVDEASGFPADPQAIRALLTAMATLTIEERKTSDPTRYADLDLGDPGTDQGAGKRIELFAGDAPVARMVLGKRDMSVGGTSGGVFARRLDEPQSWLLRGALDLPDSRAGWFDTSLLTVPAAKITAVRLQANDGASLDFASPAAGQPLALKDVPADRRAASARLTRLAGLPGNLRFQAVRRADAAVSVIGSALFTTADGSTVTIERLSQPAGASPDGKSESAADAKADAKADPPSPTGQWVRLSASIAGDDGRALLSDLAARTNGFHFQLADSDVELLVPDQAQWLEPADPPAAGSRS